MLSGLFVCFGNLASRKSRARGAVCRILLGKQLPQFFYSNMKNNDDERNNDNYNNNNSNNNNNNNKNDNKINIII
jgi:hypothetical protein